MSLDIYFNKLRRNEITQKEFVTLHKQCVRIVKKACRRYRIDEVSFNSTSKEEVYNSICMNSLLKSLVGHNPAKGAFSTFFYYKAISAARVEVGKLKRRMHVDNTVTFDETYYEGKEINYD